MTFMTVLRKALAVLSIGAGLIISYFVVTHADGTPLEGRIFFGGIASIVFLLGVEFWCMRWGVIGIGSALVCLAVWIFVASLFSGIPLNKISLLVILGPLAIGTYLLWLGLKPNMTSLDAPTSVAAAGVKRRWQVRFPFAAVSRGSYLAAGLWFLALLFAMVDSNAFTSGGSFDFGGFLAFLTLPVAILAGLDWLVGRDRRQST